MAKRPHPFPFRTRKLSSSAPMVVGAHAPVRVGRCRASRNQFSIELVFLCFQSRKRWIFERCIRSRSRLPVGFRTQKVSSRAMSLDRVFPVRVRCCWQVETSSVTDWFFCYMFIFNERKFKTHISYYVS